MNLQIEEETLTVTLADNSSARALAELLKEGPLTLSLEDYAAWKRWDRWGPLCPRTTSR